ncbi:MAG: transporter substrate-binding domain-containing protein [Syntrophobacteraceae bacterium]|jgi:polar amino acid transport system substrate-binding protein|nr:transporter substrate-binding domain-containing protein [Syntrophobacteraceae bacterium]
MRKTGRLGVFLVLSLVLAMASGPAFASKLQQQLAEESMIEQVLKRGVLKVGFSTFVPWAMTDKSGQYIGFEIDVARRLAQDMGVKVEFIPTKWSGIIPALLTGKFDIIIGGMSIKADRNLKVNFTDPYYHTGMSMVAHKELAKGFSSLEDFNKPEVVIAVRIGTTAVAAARKHLPKAQLRQFDEESQAVQELLNGRAHAFMSEEPLPAFQAVKNPDKLFLPVKEVFERSPIGLAVRKGDVDTLNFLNSWIRLIQAEGWIQERKHYWFETQDWEGLQP